MSTNIGTGLSAVERPRESGELRSRRGRGRVVRRKLLVADIVGLTAAFVLVHIALGGSGADEVTVGREVVLFLGSLPLWALLARGMGLYDRDEQRPDYTTIHDLAGVFQLATVFVWLIFVVSYATGLANPDLGKWVFFWAVSIAAVFSGRAVARSLARRSADYAQKTVIIGTDKTAQLVGRKLVHHPEYGIDLVGFVDTGPLTLRTELAHLPVLGRPDSLPELVDALGIDRVIVSFTGGTERELMELARLLELKGVQVDIVPRLFEALGPTATMNSIEGLRLVSQPPLRLTRDALAVKRTFDVVVSALLLIVTSPLFAAIAIWIKRTSPGPVFFRQTRLGLKQRHFTALKFRTMRADTTPDAHRAHISRTMTPDAAPEENGLYKLERVDTVTSAGRWLRKTSLDELPQLLNVLRGEMSLVGPRPCIPYETEHFMPHHFERFSVPAGITGLWQVKARGRSTFVEALEMDVLYARSWSFGRDVMLLLETPFQTIRPRATR